MPVIYLVTRSPTQSIYLPSESAESASSLGLHDISAHEVYLAVNVTINAVSSYPWDVSAAKPPVKVVTFSPLPRKRGGIFSVALSVIFVDFDFAQSAKTPSC